jgi:CheY-like chemotaxis protein
MSRRRILFVDDDPQLLALMGEVMRNWSDGTWEVLLAEGAGPALGILQQQPVDLIVVDIEMPVVDGIQLLKLLQRRYPSIPRTVLTGAPTEANRIACLSSGAELCLEKPSTPEKLQQLYTALNGLARLPAEEGFRGVLRRVGLPDVIQMECLAANSSVLQVTGTDANGEIFIRSGAIIHAWSGSLKGEEAFYHLLALRGGQFALNPFVAPPEQTIDVSWEFLVMEAARKVDEAREVSLPDPEAPVAAAAAPSEPIPQAGRPAPSLPGSQAPTAVSSPPATRIEEVLLCSSHGEVLYEWQCADTEARVSLLEFISQKSWMFESCLPVGHFDRLEIQGPQERLTTQIHSDRGLLVRSSQPAPRTA